MPTEIHPIPPDSTDLGADATPDLAGLMPLFLLLFSLIFKASKALVARSNTKYRRSQSCWAGQTHAGQAKTVKYVSGIKCLVVQKILLI
jgi:hypothetical protein